MSGIIAALRHPFVFLLGFREAAGTVGMTYDDDPYGPRSTAYDLGRWIGQRVRGIR